MTDEKCIDVMRGYVLVHREFLLFLAAVTGSIPWWAGYGSYWLPVGCVLAALALLALSAWGYQLRRSGYRMFT